MIEFFIVYLDGEEVRRGAVPVGSAEKQELAPGETIELVSKEAFRAKPPRSR